MQVFFAKYEDFFLSIIEAPRIFTAIIAANLPKPAQKRHNCLRVLTHMLQIVILLMYVL